MRAAEHLSSNLKALRQQRGLTQERLSEAAGIPRATYMDHPFQIIQGAGDDDILVAYEYASANRVINMEEVGIPPIDIPRLRYIEANR